MFITSRIFSGILAIGSGMQHHQKTMYNPSFKTLVLHHSELIATTSKEFVFAECQPLYHAQWRRNNHNIPVECCLPLFHSTLPFIDCALLCCLNISFAGVVSTVLGRFTVWEVMLSSSTLFSSICRMN